MNGSIVTGSAGGRRTMPPCPKDTNDSFSRAAYGIDGMKSFPAHNMSLIDIILCENKVLCLRDELSEGAFCCIHRWRTSSYAFAVSRSRLLDVDFRRSTCHKRVCMMSKRQGKYDEKL